MGFEFGQCHRQVLGSHTLTSVVADRGCRGAAVAFAAALSGSVGLRCGAVEAEVRRVVGCRRTGRSVYRRGAVDRS